jgi:flagellar basal-body rod protein FlgB
MISALFDQSSYLAAKSMLESTSLRQQAITANIANVETPGYKRLMVSESFESDLQRAVSTGDKDAIRTLKGKLTVDSSAVAAGLDGNTVRVEDELLALNQNFLENALETRLITGSLMKLRMAITGKS